MQVVLAWASASRASLGWTDEGVCPYASWLDQGVCPYASWLDQGVCPYASLVSSANFLE
jgi:hypothetical protein